MFTKEQILDAIEYCWLALSLASTQLEIEYYRAKAEYWEAVLRYEFPEVL